MAELVLALYLAYLALAFGLRGVVHYRRTGDAGVRLLRAGASGAERAGSILFAAALALGLLSPLLDLAGALPRQRISSFPAVRAAGLCLYAIGVAGTLWSQFAMGESWRIGVDPGERTELRTRGPFRLVRNPIFSFMWLAALALALLVANLASLGAVLSLLAAIQIQVRCVEEPHLLRTHRATYASYAAAAGRFVPGVGRLHFPRGEPYS
jgi:protein-S-isoprenylcysteine O-methyltransferase Ste14